MASCGRRSPKVTGRSESAYVRIRLGRIVFVGPFALAHWDEEGHFLWFFLHGEIHTKLLGHWNKTSHDEPAPVRLSVSLSLSLRVAQVVRPGPGFSSLKTKEKPRSRWWHRALRIDFYACRLILLGPQEKELHRITSIFGALHTGKSTCGRLSDMDV